MAKPLLPIELSAKRISWRLADKHASEGDAAFSSVRGKVLERDDYTCRYCGFRSIPNKAGASWQDVHHLDDNHQNNAETNLVTACCLCHQCFHLGLAGSRGGGVMIYLPEIPQAELNHLCRAIFIAMSSQSSYVPAARRLFESMELRSRYMEEVYAPGSSNPSFFGQAFLSMTDEQYANRLKAIEGVRLLGFPARFQDQIAFWIDNTFKNSLPETWEQLLQETV